ncbi:hypothetical protein [Larsenimonas suaedae]|uniref:TtsA-like Glycoside hydrolase family 108 domain-containing protein n=1 Tax=Larsenimonas suaedae TaxID=1851019 RepID=A0ABU1GSY9_9GAMM|nr:hypothetical protein [Larsenimonas suaedae]MCM2972066.1 hypothetical protein [Larsenimonas suaedae]MDR5895140.1 hypothetical protein [Larsenimonas suaedae]
MSFIETAEDVLNFRERFSADHRNALHWDTGWCGQGCLKGARAGLAAFHHPTLALNRLNDAAVIEIYEREYIRPMALERLSRSVAAFMLDTALGMGRESACRLLEDNMCLIGDQGGGEALINALLFTRLGCLNSSALLSEVKRKEVRRLMRVFDQCCALEGERTLV